VTIEEKRVQDIAVLPVSGALMGGDEQRELYKRVKKLVAESVKKVIVDLSGVNRLNSEGIGMLMGCYISLRNAHGKLVIAGATDKAYSLLLLTQVLSIITYHDTVDQAVSAFADN